MKKSLLRTDKEVNEIYDRHKKTLYRICFAYMKNHTDTEDAVQDTFFKLIESVPRFENEAHEKAWLIRTASNVCKNELKHWRRKVENIEDHFDIDGDDGIRTNDILDAVFDLPDKYKTVTYLYYYDGYTTPEIAEILKKPQSTIRNYLHEARVILKERLGDDFFEE